MTTSLDLIYRPVFLATAILVWLIPFFYTGWTKRSLTFFPKSVSFQHSAAGLFTQQSTRWWDHHLEGQRMDGSREEIPERAIFPMGAFGYRTRYDRILIESARSPLAGKVRKRLAEQVLKKYPPDPAGAPFPYRAIRLVRTLWTVGAPGMAEPEGQWNPPPVTEVTKVGERQLLGTYAVSRDRLTEVPMQPAAGMARVLAKPEPRPAAAPGGRPLLSARPPRDRPARTPSGPNRASLQMVPAPPMTPGPGVRQTALPPGVPVVKRPATRAVPSTTTPAAGPRGATSPP